ncbi:uncharacterized protein LOC117646303 [Thrips palmi]|uniref:Uncharacterized protein LOC117646303 n=1 Tax=Thrips palmi TaxID=161013 RepID=A0A6P8ZNW3_THRPL|nr:uncharacterized protein LOC117646303 [Thrips palmi]
MLVSRPLSVWLWLLQTAPPLSARQWLWALCVGSKMSLAAMVLANAMLLMAAVRGGGSVKESTAGTLMSCGFFSCSTAHAVYLVRRPRARAILTGMMRVAAAMEHAASPDEQAALERAGRGICWMTAVQLTYAAGMVVSVWAYVLYGAHPYAPMWPHPPLPGHWGEHAVSAFEMLTMFLGCLGYFSLVTLMGSEAIALAGLYEALGVRLQAARGWHEVISAVQLHQRLNGEARQYEHFFADIIAHLMVAILVVPLVATLQVVFNVVDPLTFTSSSILLSVFLPMATLSQNLTDASTAMADRAYYAAFQDPPPPDLLPPSWALEGSKSLAALARHAAKSMADLETRKALLLVIASASRPAHMSVKGFGPVSLRTASQALRVWYQWGNMLVGFSTRVGVSG